MGLQTRFNQHIQQTGLFQAKDRVLIAVSTGADSMTLWQLCRQLPTQLRPQIEIAYVDHHLRAESTQETAFIQAIAAQRQTPLFQKDWWPKEHPKEGIEAAARKVRYAFFYQVMQQQNCTILLTAHHGDDLAETILMKLVRSGTLNSTTGFTDQRKFHEFMLARPLLPFSKEEIYQFADAEEITYFEDATNQNDDFFRNRLRHHVIPALKEENTHFLEHMAYFSKSLNSLLVLQKQELPTLLQQQGIQKTSTGIKGSVNAFVNYPQAAQLALLQEIWTTYFEAIPIKSQQIQAMLELLNGQKPQVQLDLGRNLQFKRVYQSYFIEKNQTLGVSIPQTFPLKLNHWQLLPDHTEIGIFEHVPTSEATENIVIQSVLLEKNDWPLTVRHRRPGDRYLLDNGNHGKLKKLLIDRQVPQNEREAFWLVFANKDLLWIPNFRFFQLFHSSETDKIRFVLCFKHRL